MLQLLAGYRRQQKKELPGAPEELGQHLQQVTATNMGMTSTQPVNPPSPPCVAVVGDLFLRLHSANPHPLPPSPCARRKLLALSLGYQIPILNLFYAFIDGGTEPPSWSQVDKLMQVLVVRWVPLSLIRAAFSSACISPSFCFSPSSEDMDCRECARERDKGLECARSYLCTSVGGRYLISSR